MTRHTPDTATALANGQRIGGTGGRAGAGGLQRLDHLLAVGVARPEPVTALRPRCG
jgi:hypothetical protein